MEPDSRCSNCNAPYVLEADSRKKQAGVKLPLLLKCGHCYCSQCLHGIAKQLRFTAIPCPECRVPTPLSPNARLTSQLPLSYYTVGVVRAVQLGLKKSLFFSQETSGTSEEDEEGGREKMVQEEETASSSLECEECETRLAQVKCTKCDCVFCVKCFEVVHSSSKTLRLHKQVSLTEEDTVTYPDDEVEPKMKLLDDVVSTGKVHVVSLKRMATIVTANENKIIDGGDRSLETCRAEVCQLHHHLEASLAAVELDYRNTRRGIIRDYRSLRDGLQKEEKLLSSLLEKAKLLVHNKKLLIQNCNSVVSEIQEAMDHLPKLQETCSKGRTLRVVSNPKSVDLTHLFTLESKEDRLPIIFEPDHTLSLNKTHPQATSSRPETIPVKNNFLSLRSSAVSMRTPSSQPSSQGSSRISSRGSSRGASPLLEHGRVTGEELESAVPCKVTHVETPSEFWVQFDEEINKLETLEKFVCKYCKDNKREPFLEKGTICAGLTREGMWCRGMIEKVVWGNPRCATFMLIDYGATEMVSIGNLCGIPDKWSGLPPLAHKCSLGGVRPVSNNVAVAALDWTQNTVSFFRSVTLKQNNIKLKVLSRGWSQESMCELLMVDMFLPAARSEGLSISHMMIQQGKAQRMKEKAPLQPKDLPIGPIPPAGTKIEVDMITAQSPSDFYVVPAGANDHMCSLISTHISSNPPLVPSSSLVPGALVIAPYDREHYRAKVLEWNDSGAAQVLVQFLDYGNTSLVDASGLYDLTKKLGKIPPGCYHCQLDKSAGRVWPEAVCQKFYDMTTERRLLMVVEGPIVGGVLPVKLMYYENGQNVWDLLEPSPVGDHVPLLATPPPVVLPPVGFEGRVIIKHVQNPLLFHVVLCNKLSLFDSIESCDPVTFPSPSVPKEGEYCHALFPSDQKYHRGIVKSVSEDCVSCEVYYLDYGNTEGVPISSLLPLPDELCQEPALAVPCRLYGVDETYEFNYEKSMKFYKQIFEKKVTAVIKEVQLEPPCAVVSLFCDLSTGQGLDVLSTLDVEVVLSGDDASLSSHPSPPSSSGTCNSSQTPPPTTPPTFLSPRSHKNVVCLGSSRHSPVNCPKYFPAVRPTGAEFIIVVTFVDQNGTIYGQPVAYSDQFNEIDDKVSRVVSSSHPVSSLVSVSHHQGCVARYSEDGQWYRATVTNISVDRKTAEVYFVDFGNSGIVRSHDVIGQLAAPSVPELALSFTEYSSLGQESLGPLVDKEITVMQNSTGNCKLYIKGVELQHGLFTTLPLPPSSPSSMYSSS